MRRGISARQAFCHIFVFYVRIIIEFKYEKIIKNVVFAVKRLHQDVNVSILNTLVPTVTRGSGMRACGQEYRKHDRWFLDRICAHILACESDSQWTFFTGNYQEYEEDKIKRLGEKGAKPKQLRYRPISR